MVLGLKSLYTRVESRLRRRSDVRWDVNKVHTLQSREIVTRQALAGHPTLKPLSLNFPREGGRGFKIATARVDCAVFPIL